MTASNEMLNSHGLQPSDSLNQETILTTSRLSSPMLIPDMEVCQPQ